MKKINKKALISAATTAFATLAIAKNTFASEWQITEADKQKIYGGDSNGITTKVMPILNIAMYLIDVALVIVAILKGIQYMNAAADPEAKAKTKKELIFFVAGAFIVFGITRILNIIYNLSQNTLG